MAENQGGTTQINDLDLLEIESDDIDALASKIESFYKLDTIIKQQLSYHWTRNHLMIDGQQWLIYDRSSDGSGEWRKMEPSAANEYIPRPVSNLMFDIYQTLKSYLLKNKPRMTVRPNTQSEIDKTAAKLAELISETNWERLSEETNYEYAASCAITYGTVFKKDYWDMSYLSVARVPKMVEQPQVDPATGAVIGTQMIEQRDEYGNVITEDLPIGDVSTAVVEPFRITMDPLATSITDCRWIMEYSIQPINWIKENFGQSGNGYTGRVEEVKEEKTLSTSMRRFYRLKSSSGVKGSSPFPGVNSSVGATDIMINNAAVVKEYYERPTHKHPKGRLIVVANNIPLYVGDSPYQGTEKGDWHPYSEFRWEIFPGRFWGKSPLDEVAELQRHVNSIDSLIMLNRKTMAVPQKLIPQGAAIPSGYWTGRPGLQIPYRATGGEKPEVIPGVGLDPQVFQERVQKVEEMKTISGAVDILKGDRPPGVTAASAISLLFEVGSGKLFPILDRWKKFTECSQKKQLKLVAVRYKEPRPDFIRMLLMKNKDLTEAQIRNFIGDDLYDNCNIVQEASSSIPKLRATEQAMLLELAGYGVLGLEQPENKKEFLDRFGIKGFDEGYSLDVGRAEYENAMFENLLQFPDNKPVRLITDKDEIHVQIHGDFTKHPRFMQMPFQIQQQVFMHLQEHQMAIEQKQMMQMQQQIMLGASGAPNAIDRNTEAQGAEPGKPVGKGVSNKVKDAMMGDVLGPAAGLKMGS